MSAPDVVVRAVQDESDCVKVYAPTLNAHYCEDHGNGWLSDRDCCPAEARMADAAFAASLEWAATKEEQVAEELFGDGATWAGDFALAVADDLRRWADESEAAK